MDHAAIVSIKSQLEVYATNMKFTWKVVEQEVMQENRELAATL